MNLMATNIEFRPIAIRDAALRRWVAGSLGRHPETSAAKRMLTTAVIVGVRSAKIPSC